VTSRAPNRPPTALSIAGSDSGGGAGIQADLKAFARAGVHGMTAITAVTAQSTVGVDAVFPLGREAILAQVRSVAGDIGVDAVKIGMLGDEETIAAVAESGAVLLDPLAVKALVDRLMPRATVVTPNVDKARQLAAQAGDGGKAVASEEELDQEALARAVHGLGAKAVVVTGGHANPPDDVFFDGTRLVGLPGERYPDGAAHGSGCTHSSTLAAHLALGDDPLDAAREARRVAGEAVRNGLRGLGAGAGPVDVFGIG